MVSRVGLIGVTGKDLSLYQAKTKSLHKSHMLALEEGRQTFVSKFLGGLRGT